MAHCVTCPQRRSTRWFQTPEGISWTRLDSTTLEQKPLVSETTLGIEGILQRALQKRSVAMGLSSSEGEDSGDDEEWDD